MQVIICVFSIYIKPTSKYDVGFINFFDVTFQRPQYFRFLIQYLPLNPINGILPMSRQSCNIR